VFLWINRKRKPKSEQPGYPHLPKVEMDRLLATWGPGESRSHERKPEVKVTNPELPNFETCLLLGLEMLKRGAKSVDMHPWGLRLRAPTEELNTWSVGLIPQRVQEEYAQSLFGDPPPLGEVEPIDPDPNVPSSSGEVNDDERDPLFRTAP